MQTILRSGPYRFYWFSNEGVEPPHIHVDRDNQSAKFWLNPVNLARNIGFSGREFQTIRSIIELNHSYLLEVWHEHHGSKNR